MAWRNGRNASMVREETRCRVFQGLVEPWIRGGYLRGVTPQPCAGVTVGTRRCHRGGVSFDTSPCYGLATGYGRACEAATAPTTPGDWQRLAAGVPARFLTSRRVNPPRRNPTFPARPLTFRGRCVAGRSGLREWRELVRRGCGPGWGAPCFLESEQPSSPRKGNGS